MIGHFCNGRTELARELSRISRMHQNRSLSAIGPGSQSHRSGQTPFAGGMDRRQFLLATIAGTSLACQSGPTVPADRPTAISRLFARLHEQRLFDGEALVAERGIVVYSGAFGVADREAKFPYTTSTPSCLASLSKPVTAIALMMLAENGAVTFETQLGQLLPGFSPTIGAVTVRQLLTHTSGVPDYPDIGVDRPGVTNAEILAALRRVTDRCSRRD